MIFNKKKFGPILKIFFIPRSPRTTWNNRSSPHNGPIKKFFSLKSYYLCITNKEIMQIPKPESKKFSILCTFKEMGAKLVARLLVISQKFKMGDIISKGHKLDDAWLDPL